MKGIPETISFLRLDALQESGWFVYVAAAVSVVLLILAVLLVVALLRSDTADEEFLCKQERPFNTKAKGTGYGASEGNLSSYHTEVQEAGRTAMLSSCEKTVFHTDAEKTVMMQPQAARDAVLKIYCPQPDGSEANCLLYKSTLDTLEESCAVIGRAEDVHVRFMDMSVSRRHLLLSWQGGGFCLMDCKSSYGVQVNGKRVIPSVWIPVNHGDVVRLGNVQLRLEVEM